MLGARIAENGKAFATSAEVPQEIADERCIQKWDAPGEIVHPVPR
jgi:hypothetical protein